MIIKKYVANDLEQAMQRMREELGPEAVVLTSRAINNNGFFGFFASRKVEVTAAVEPAQLKAFKDGLQQRVEAPPQPQQKRNTLDDNLAAIKRSMREELEPMPAPEARVAAPAASSTYGDPRLKRRAPTPAAATPMAPVPEKAQEGVEDFERTAKGLMAAFHKAESEIIDDITPQAEPVRKVAVEPVLKKQIEKSASVSEDSIRKVIREEMERAQESVNVGALDDNDADTVGSTRFLLSKGIARSIALEIHQQVTDKVPNVDLKKPSKERGEYLNALNREIARRVKTAGPIVLSPGRATPVALVGPTGVGKTTTLAKIAWMYHGQLRKKVGIISLDTVKLGAREQIKLLADKLGISHQVVSSQAQLSLAIDRFADKDLILIDTAGCNQYQKSQVDDLAELLSVVPGLRVQLTVSSVSKDVDVIGTITNFSPLSIDSIILTKLDETIAHGVMVNVCEKTGLPISYLTCGQSVPGDIQLAEATDISKSILLEHNSAADRRVRSLVGA